ncbi:MAG: tetratricopeptide repeat protein [Acidobacteriota bacterium]
MRTSERHHLKDNEFAILLSQVTEWATRHRRALTFTVAVAGVAAIAFGGWWTWRGRVDASARALLADAMVVAESRVVPPPAPVEGVNASPALPQPGTFPTYQAKLETALPKFFAAADQYPSSDAGLTARYHAAGVLVELGRPAEAVAQYERVMAEGSGLLARMARLGKAEAQLRASQYDAAIASFKELSDRQDVDLPKEALLLELARAYKVAGKRDDARRTLTQLVEQHADSPFAAEARQELERLEG